MRKIKEFIFSETCNENRSQKVSEIMHFNMGKNAKKIFLKDHFFISFELKLRLDFNTFLALDFTTNNNIGIFFSHFFTLGGLVRFLRISFILFTLYVFKYFLVILTQILGIFRLVLKRLTEESMCFFYSITLVILLGHLWSNVFAL